MSFLGGLAHLLGTVGHDINQVNPFSAQTAIAPSAPRPQLHPSQAPVIGGRQYPMMGQAKPMPYINSQGQPLPPVPMGHNFNAFHTAGLSSLAQLLGNINTATGMTGPGMIHGEQDIPMQGQSYYQTPFR